MLTLVSALILVIFANDGAVTAGLTGSSSLHEVKKNTPNKANRISFECFIVIGFNWLISYYYYLFISNVKIYDFIGLL